MKSLAQVGGTQLSGFNRSCGAILPGNGATPIANATATLTTAGAGVLLAALLSTGWLQRDPSGAARTDTTDTAANILADVNFRNLLPDLGADTRVRYENTGEAAETLTLAAGVGVTLAGQLVIPPGAVAELRIIRTSRAGSTAAVLIVSEIVTSATATTSTPGVTGATVTTIATAAAVTYTAAQIAGGVIRRDPAGAGRADLVDTAANLIAGLGLLRDGDSRDFLLVNTADDAETITITTNTGVSLKNTATVAQNEAVRVTVLRTSSTTADVIIQGR
jgi:hypothetical protein